MIVTPKLRHLSRAEVREIDTRTINKYHLPGIVLMENAGRGAAEVLLTLGLRETASIVVGKGNNGGDGFVIARFLQLAGVDVRVFTMSHRTDFTGDALIQMNVAAATGLPIAFEQDITSIVTSIPAGAWIIDAILGTGASGSVRAPLGGLIDAVNESGNRVVSIDVPSGMNCDTGKSLGSCIRATDTITFVAPKLGFGQPSAAQFIGNVHVVGIGAPLAVLAQFIQQ